MSEKKGMKTRKLLRSFLPYYGRYKKILIFDLFCVALTTLRELTLPLMLRYVTNQRMQDLASVTAEVVIWIGGLYLLLRIIDSLAAYYMAYTEHVMGIYIETDMRQDVFEHLQMLSDSYYNNTKVGQIMSRITSDLFDVTGFAHHCPEESFIAALKIMVSFIILSSINLKLTPLTFVLVPVMIISYTWFNLKVKEAFHRQGNQVGGLSAQIEDTPLGNRVARAFANEPVEIAKFGRGNRDFMDTKEYTYRYMAAFRITTRSFNGLMYAVVIVARGIFMIQGKVELGGLVAYTMYVTTLLTTIRRIIKFAEQSQRGITGIERFQEIMDVVPDIRDSKNTGKMEHIRGAISFDHIGFEYPDDHVSVLEDINITVRPGKRIALVGPSSGSKTTMCNLLPRFYGTTSDSITIDGQDIKSATLQSLRPNIGAVQQDMYLFSGPVYENIGYGRPGATREEAVEIAKLAGAHEFATGLQDGYSIYVGERGIKLSGGQKQHISIARVFLKSPTILILDEAASALNNEGGYLVSQSLGELAVGRITLTIIHRLTTIQGTGRILVLSGNQIVEEGNHEQLLEKKGMHYQLYATTDRPNRGIAQRRTSNMKIAIVAGSNSGVTQDEIKKLDIYVLPMPFMIDGQVFYGGIDLSHEEFYRRTEEGADITTSQPSSKGMMEQWEQLLENHDQMVYIPMSSGLSGSCQTTLMLAKEYEGRAQVVSNQGISVTQRQSALDVRDLAELGWSSEQVKEKLEATRFDSSIYVTVDTFGYLKKGGRITPTAAALGALLRIKPILIIRKEKLDAFVETRTMKQAKTIMLAALTHDLEERLADRKAEHTYLQIAHTCSKQTTHELEETVRGLYPGVPVFGAPPSLSIGCHIGSGALAATCIGKLKELE